MLEVEAHRLALTRVQHLCQTGDAVIARQLDDVAAAQHGHGRVAAAGRMLDLVEPRDADERDQVRPHWF